MFIKQVATIRMFAITDANESQSLSAPQHYPQEALWMTDSI